ncbi:hypothetical protein GGTG_08308 [Gaeumannomyces tritici R3-111a-1]|uniref:SPRY domain-containing protein n=1 Tax=Gaeumannomyces tritici (strain R3-111a-1) TaxID=644352 RepID=J3P472_GAET3|nr:hypothetical protein GGTG_08308 [Gaeumannomyces tritici R3-111a-1]EJT74468.1 hypothetical protein GGTG_08308 [Gaeumannomyces tritici R3-111a-1]
MLPIIARSERPRRSWKVVPTSPCRIAPTVGLLFIQPYSTLEILELLILHKPDVNLPDRDGISPIHAAVEYGSLEAVRLLLRRGTKMQAQTHKGETCLSLAVSALKDQVLEVLLEGASCAGSWDYRDLVAAYWEGILVAEPGPASARCVELSLDSNEGGRLLKERSDEGGHSGLMAYLLRVREMDRWRRVCKLIPLALIDPGIDPFEPRSVGQETAFELGIGMISLDLDSSDYIEACAKHLPRPLVPSPTIGFRELRIATEADTADGGGSYHGKGVPSVRADFPFPHRNSLRGLPCFEITIEQASGPVVHELSIYRWHEVAVKIGFCGELAYLKDGHLGWQPWTAAFRGDNASMHQESIWTPTMVHFGPGSTVGCGINYRTGEYLYTLDGDLVERLTSNIIYRKLYLCICHCEGATSVTVNFGTSDFAWKEDEQLRISGRSCEDTG